MATLSATRRRVATLVADRGGSSVRGLALVSGSDFLQHSEFTCQRLDLPGRDCQMVRC